MPDSIGKASLITILGSYLGLPVALVTGILLARVAGPEVKGLFTVFTVTQGFLILPGFALQAALTRFIAHRRPNSRSVWPRVRWVIVAQSLLSIGLVAAVLPFRPVRQIVFSGLDARYLIPVFIFVAINLWYFYRSAAVSGLQMYSRNAAVFYAAGLASNLLFIVVLLAWWVAHFVPTVGWVIAASLAGSLLAVAIWYVTTSQVRVFEGEDVPGREMARDVTGFAAPVLLRIMLEWANLRLDVYFVNAFVGASALGVYTIAVGASQQLWAIPFSVAGPLFSRISRDGDTVTSRETARFAFRILVLMSLALAVLVGAIAPFLIPLVYGSRFSGAIVPLLLLLPGVVAISPTRALASYFTGIGRPSEPLIAEAIGLVATVALDLVLISRHGAAGAGIASSAAYIAFSGYLTYRFKRVSQSAWRELFALRRQDVSIVWRRLLELIPARIKKIPSSVGHSL